MNTETIRELADIMRENGLTSLEWEQEGQGSVKLKREAAIPPAPVPLASAPAVAAQAPAAFVPLEENTVNFNNLKEIKSPMVGVFYAAAKPGEQPFVAVGSRVKKGDILCIIEAMKLMNEIVAEESGEIVDVCVSNGDVVEFSQTIFKIC